MNATAGQPKLRRWKRWMTLSLVVVFVVVFARHGPKPFEKEPFYAFLERHTALQQVVRPLFWLAGKEEEFQFGIAIASLNRIVDEQRVQLDLMPHIVVELDGQQVP